MQEPKYVTVIGDLVGSRSLEPKERVEVQKRFEATLEKINRDFGSEIASLFLITAGDETQGILKHPTCCYEILRQIQIDLTPTEIVFGVGVGTLTTEIGEYAVGADGPAFHLAREALTTVKEERKAYGKSILREVRFHSNLELFDTVVNGFFLALSVVKSHWTDKQTRILNLLEKGKNPTDVAKMLDVPLSNVSRTVETARFREYESFVESLQSMLQGGLEAFSKVG